MTKNTVKPGLTRKPVKRANRVVENDQFDAFVRRILRAYARRVAGGDVEALRSLAQLSSEVDSVTRLAVFIATVGYCGYFPIAPGTVGSAAGLVFYLLVWWTQSPIVEVGLIAVVYAVGIWAGTTAERYFGGIDPGPVVIDEVLGMLITLAFMPVGVATAIGGFFLFRVFDIIKPFPAGRLESLHGGLGVMSDDAMAAVYANLTLRAVVYLLPGWFA